MVTEGKGEACCILGSDECTSWCVTVKIEEDHVDDDVCEVVELEVTEEVSCWS